MKKRFLCKLVAAVMSVLAAVSSMSAYGVVTFGAERAVDDSWKKKLDNVLLEKMEEGDGKIPVWLWMVDIDKEELEKRVYEKTGLNEKNLDVIGENISQNLSAEIADMPEMEADQKTEKKKMFQDYLERTEAERKEEARRVEIYLEELRKTQAEMCRESNKIIFSQLGIPEENIIISETLAPLYIVYIEKDDIQRVAENPLVTAMYYYDMDAVAVPEIVEIPDDFDPAAPSDDVSGTDNEKTEELPGKDQYGDTNRNGIYETSDALEILKMTVRLQETDSYADANLDGKVTAEDALEVLKLVVKSK